MLNYAEAKDYLFGDPWPLTRQADDADARAMLDARDSVNNLRGAPLGQRSFTW